MSNLESSVKDFVSDPIGYTTGKVTGDPNEAVGLLKNYKPYGFSSAGLSGSLQNGTFQLTRSPELQAQLGGLQSALSQRALEFANLRKGMGRDTSQIIGALRETGVNAIQGRKRRAIGDLRENLARRRVAGSSFAADALTRAEAQFAQEEAQFGAEVGVKEFELGQQVLAKDIELLNAETEANVQSFQTGLTQLNLESGLAAQISTAMSGIAAENAKAIGQIMAEYAAARANIVGTAAGIGLSKVLSDERIKKDIKEIKKLGPLTLYNFKYLWSDKEETGFMAQEVEKYYPDCVVNESVKMIDYKKLRERVCH